MSKPPKTEMAYVRLPADEMKRLRQLSKRDERPLAHLIRTAVEQYLNRRKS